MEISIGGIFTINSPSENAFSHAVYLHNAKKKKRFRLLSSLAMLPHFESHTFVNKVCKWASERRMIAIFGGNFTSVAEDASDLARTLQLPVFIADENNNDLLAPPLPPSRHNYVLQLLPPVGEPLANYLVGRRWHTFSYLCSSRPCLLRLQRLVEAIHSLDNGIELHVDVRYISDVRLATKDLQGLSLYLDSVANGRKRVVVVDLERRDHINLLMERVVLVGMNRPEYEYVITSLEIEDIDLDEFKYSGVNVTGFRVIEPTGQRFNEFRKSWREWNYEPRSARAGSLTLAALMYDAVQLLVHALERLLDTSRLKDMLQDRSPQVNCYTMKMPGRRKVVGYQSGRYEVKRSMIGSLLREGILAAANGSGLSGRLNFNNLGMRENFAVTVLSMELEQGLVPQSKWGTVVLGEDTAAGVNGSITNGSGLKKNDIVKVVGIIVPPFMQVKKAKHGEVLRGNERFEGFCIDLLSLMAEMLHFKYEVEVVADNKYGASVASYANGTETWNGLVGELLSGAADMVVAPLTISLARARVVDFSEPFLTFGISVMIKRPGRTNPGIFSFMRPLADEVWVAYFAACILISGGLYVITRISPYEGSVPYDNGPGKKTTTETVTSNFSLDNSVWFSFAASVQQGVDLSPHSPGARILSSVWWFFTMIMTAYYTANLVAFLTVSLIIPPINDFADLVTPGIGIEYGSTNSGSTKDFFLTTRLSPFYEMGRAMSSNPTLFTDTVENGVKRVIKSKGKYAFLLESRMNEYYNNREPCETMMVGRSFGDKGYGIALPLNSPWKEDINDAVLKLREGQVLDRLYNTWWIDKGRCLEDSSQAKQRPLALINVAGVFYILSVGLTVAMVASWLECWYTARRTQSDRHRECLLRISMADRVIVPGHGIDSGDGHIGRRLGFVEDG